MIILEDGFVIALKSERESDEVKAAIDNGYCLIVEDGRPIQVCVDDCNVIQRIALGVVLKKMVAYDSLDDESLEEFGTPIFANLLHDFAFDLTRNSFGGEDVEIHDEDKKALKSLLNQIILVLRRKNLVICTWDEFTGESHIKEEATYGLSEEFLTEIARGKIKIS